MAFRRITTTEAKKLWLAGKSVYLCPHKLHPCSPWNMATLVTSAEWLEAADRHGPTSEVWDGSRETTAWALMLNNWRYYNASYETGYYPHYYVESK